MRIVSLIFRSLLKKKCMTQYNIHHLCQTHFPFIYFIKNVFPRRRGKKRETSLEINWNMFWQMSLFKILINEFKFHVSLRRAVRGEVVVQPAAPLGPLIFFIIINIFVVLVVYVIGRPAAADGRAGRERAAVGRGGVHGAPHPYQPAAAVQRGDGQHLVQSRDQRTLGQVPRARHRDDHHQVGKVNKYSPTNNALCYGNLFNSRMHLHLQQAGSLKHLPALIFL